MPNQLRDDEQQPEVPPLTPGERAFVLERAGEAYFTLMMGLPTPERDDLLFYGLVRTIFFRNVWPQGNFKQAELKRARKRADELWEGLTAYMASNPQDWVFPQQRLSKAELNRLACTVRKAAERIHTDRYQLIADRSKVYVSLPVESFFDIDPNSGTVKPESISVDEVQIPFALRLRVRDDMILFPEEAIKAFQRIMAGEYGVSLREHLQEAPELEQVLADGDDAVLLVSPDPLPPPTMPFDEPQTVITAHRVRSAVLEKFRRGDCEISYYAGRCYVDIPRLGPDGEAGRYICYENPAGTGLSFQQV